MKQTIITISSRATRQEILRALNTILPKKSPRCITISATRLKQLGALRLMRLFGDWKKALAYAQKKKSADSIAPLYVNQEQWCRDRTKARQAIASILDRLL